MADKNNKDKKRQESLLNLLLISPLRNVVDTARRAFNPPFVQETRQAQALLRSLQSGSRVTNFTEQRVVPVRTASRRGRVINSDVTKTSVPAINKNVYLSNLDTPTANPTFDVSFENIFSGRSGPRGARPASMYAPDPNMTRVKQAALQWMLGDALSTQMPDQANWDIFPTTGSRSRLYRMQTQGAIPTNKGQRVNATTWQGRDAKGRFLNQVAWNPETLKQPLQNLAAPDVSRQVIMNAAMRRINNPYVQAAIVANDLYQGITGNSIFSDFSEGMTKSLKANPKQNVGPLLPF